MNFNSFSYILLFLPAVFILIQLARRLSISKAPQMCLLLASIYFYAWDKPINLVYLFGSILVNWQLSRWISGAAPPFRKNYLRLGLVFNICLLCIFKYVDFFLRSVPYLAQHIKVPALSFPLGISFFTLAQVMYLVDCYENLTTPNTLFDHATFVSFFPYVISGPIARSKRIVHQFPELNARTGPDSATISRALYLFSLGLIKKVVIADAFSKVADYGFSTARNMSTLEAWVFASAYTFQIYFDFSGYSDMAIASALFFGIDIPRNFDAPLKSLSIIEFWKRWHISLSAFITTYLYTPIIKSFSRATLFTAAVATLVAMTITGLWHGPSWTFVVFGFLHGVGLVINQYWKKKKMPTLPNSICWLLTFALVDLAFVFFRSPDMHFALHYIPQLIGTHHPFSTANLRQANGAGLMVGSFLLTEIIGIVVAFFGHSSEQLAREFSPTWLNYAATVAFTLISWLFLNSSVSKPFVYFAF